MAINWAAAYEAPISLDAPRMIGTRARRPTIWTLAAVAVLIPVACAIVAIAVPQVQAEIPEWVGGVVIAAAVFAGAWLPFCYVMGSTWGSRPAEYWLKRWFAHGRIPKRLDGEALARYHANVALRTTEQNVAEHVLDINDYPRVVIEVATSNLQLRDADTLAGFLKQFHMFLIGLRFPIRIVVRARQNVGYVERRWFIAVSADTDSLLEERVGSLLSALKRAKLGGRVLNGDLYDSLQWCWGAKPIKEQVGPSVIKHDRRQAIVDDVDIVRGFVMVNFPRIVDPNWMAGILDGDLAIDYSMYLDPIDNVTELDVLAGRIVEWETSQVLHFNSHGFRDPDVDDMIKDAQRTRLYLRRRELRVFQGAVHFAVRDPDAKIVDERERLLMDRLREHVGDQAVIPMDWEQHLAPLISVPLGEPPAMLPLQLVSPAVAMGYPFSNSSVRMDGGPVVGTSIGSKRLNTLNTFTLNNPHIIIPGTTGSGKGFWLKVFIWRLLKLHPEWRIWIIQSEKAEYSALVDAMPQTPKSHPKRDAMYSHEVEAMDDYALLLNEQPAEHWQAMRGETIRIESLDEFDSKVYRTGYGGKLTQFLRGEQLTLFDITRMPAPDKGEAIARLIEAIDVEAQIEETPSLGYVAIDELGIVLNDKRAAVAIDTAYRRFRSIPHLRDERKISRRGMIGLTQLPSDLLGNPNGKILASLSETHLYLRQQASELRVTKATLNLTPDEAEFLETCDNGDALLVAGRARVALHLYADPEEEAFAVT